MNPGSIELLPAERARQLTELAEKARDYLTRLARSDVSYDATGVQLLDEWIERYLQFASDPPTNTRLAWTAFLGEVLRRRFGCEWALQEDGTGHRSVILVYSVGVSDQKSIDISAQIGKRITDGIAASAACFYLATAIELRSRDIESSEIP
ncbi:MAG: hypothetical protein GX620_01665 [Chloroflexi bacterium]|nr:hypothetical protein [Chloroflexota bacterium]